MNSGCSDTIQGMFGLVRRLVFASLLVVMGLAGWGQGGMRSSSVAALQKRRVVERKMMLPPMGRCPLRNGVVVVYTGRIWGGACGPRGGGSIEAADSVVLSSRSGAVQAIFNVADVHAVMIRATDSFFYTYSNLDSVLVVKGQVISAGQVIGYKTAELPLEFVITNKLGTNLPDLKRVDCRVEYRKRR